MNWIVKSLSFVTLSIGLIVSSWTIFNVIAPFAVDSSVIYYQRQQNVKSNTKRYVSVAFSQFQYFDLHTPGFHYQGLNIVEADLKQENNKNPNYSDESILIMSCNWAGHAHSFLVRRLLMLQEDKKKQTGIFVIQQQNEFPQQDSKKLKEHTKNVLSLIKNLIQIRSIKKLSIFAFQEGAMVVLQALSQANPHLLAIINQIVVINPFSSHHLLYYNDAQHVSYTIKSQIINLQRLQQFNRIKIILISTFKTVYEFDPQFRHQFLLTFKDAQGQYFKLAKSVFISSKYMWKVHKYFPPGQYFYNQNFLKQIARLFNFNKRNDLDVKQIDDLMRYSHVKNYNERKRKWNCAFNYLQTINSNPIVLGRDCYHFQLKQSDRFVHSALLIYSNSKIQVFGPKKQKIPSIYAENNHFRFILTNLQQLRQFYVFGNSTSHTNLVINAVSTPSFYPIIYNNKGQNIYSNKTENKSIRIVPRSTLYYNCEGGVQVLGLFSQVMQVKKWKQGNCYISLQGNLTDYLAEYIWIKWYIIKNLIIFGIFASHILKTESYSRFYSELQIFVIIYYLISGNIAIIEPLVAISMAASYEGMAKAINKISQSMNITGDYNWIGSILPLAAELLTRNNIGLNYIGNSFKLLSAQVTVAHGAQGYLISFLKFYFMLDLYASKSDPIYDLALITGWQIINQLNLNLISNNKTAIIKRKVADWIFLLMMLLCVDEDIGVMHQCLNYYIIVHLILSAQNKFRKQNDMQ